MASEMVLDLVSEMIMEMVLGLEFEMASGMPSESELIGHVHLKVIDVV